MTVQDFNRALLALESWREADDDSMETMVAIACLIFNRAQRDEIGLGEAILKHREFNRIETDPNKYPDARDPKIAKLVMKVSDLGTPFGEDLTGGGIYMLDLSKPVPEHLSFLLKHPKTHEMCGMLGTRKFFK